MVVEILLCPILFLALHKGVDLCISQLGLS